MDNKILLTFGLKCNPFAPNIPTDALYIHPQVNDYLWRVEQLAREGGCALINGAAGSSKSTTLRLLAERLAANPEIRVGVLTRPQSNIADFYREMGDLFGVHLTPSNRWNGAKVLRQRWQEHIEQALYRPVLIIDEAQETRPAVLTELRLLGSTKLDSHLLLTIVLAGDSRLLDKFRSDELIPFGSRIRTRINLLPATPDELNDCLRHVLKQAGNPRLMTEELQRTLCEHAAGNYRVLMTMANELLFTGYQREAKILDEKLYFDVFNLNHAPKTTSPSSSKRKNN